MFSIFSNFVNCEGGSNHNLQNSCPLCTYAFLLSSRVDFHPLGVGDCVLSGKGGMEIIILGFNNARMQTHTEALATAA